MIEERARVVALAGEQSVWLETQRQSVCSQCAVNQGCGTGALSSLFGRRHARVRALNKAAAGIGDEVIVGIPEQALVRGSLWVYALPLAGLLAGAILGRTLLPGVSSGETASILCGLGGLVLGFYGVSRHTRRAAQNPDYQPVVLRRAADAGVRVALPPRG